MRAGSLVLALLVLGAGMRAEWALDAEGFLTGRVAVPLAFATALVLVGFAYATSSFRAAAWVSLGVIGQAAALQLMRAGRDVGYQHYAPVAELVDPAQLPWIIILGVQSIAVLFGLLRSMRDVRRGLRRIGLVRLVAISAVFVLTSATLSREPSAYVGELVLASALQLLGLATIALAALAIPAATLGALRGKLDAVLGDRPDVAGGGGRGIDLFAVLCACWVVLITGLLAWFSYERHPHVPDEVIYLYHARYFARGLLWMTPPPVPEAFNLDLMTYEAARWYSPMLPGWPALLAIGTAAGAAWLVNPILAGVNILLAYVLVRELYDRRTARLTVLLLSASPWLLFMAMNFMAHTVTLTAGLLASVCVALMRRTGATAWAVPGGLALGFLALVRPLEAVIAAGVAGTWSLIGAGRLHIMRTTALAACAILGAAITFPYNRVFTGSATYFPLTAYTDARYGENAATLGFGPDRGLGWTGLDPIPGHGALDVLVNLNIAASHLNTELFGWSTGSLLLIALFAVFPLAAWKRADAGMAAVVAAVIAAHTLYWFSGGADFGPRYWFLAIVPCTVLTVRGLQSLGNLVGDGATRGLAATAGLVLATLVTFIPWRAADKYHNYRGMRPDVRELAAVHDWHGSLVLIRGNRHPDYASAAAYNPVQLSADAPIYAWDLDPDVRRRTLMAYPDRAVWIVAGPTVTGAGYRVIGGPIRAQVLLAEMGMPGSGGERR